MLIPLLTFTLAQNPPAATPMPTLGVLVTGRSGIAESRADAFAFQVVELLESEGVPVTRSPKGAALMLSAAGLKDTDCRGRPACVASLGRVLKVSCVLGIELADLDGTLAVYVMLVDADQGDRHAELELVMKTRQAEASLAAQLKAFVPTLKSALGKVKIVAEPNRPAPPVPALTPLLAALPAPERKPEVVAPPPTSRSLLGPAVTLGGGVAAVGVALTFLILATQTRAQLDAARTTTPNGETAFKVSEAQANAWVTQANTHYSVALGTALGAAVLVAVAVVLFIAGR